MLLIRKSIFIFTLGLFFISSYILPIQASTNNVDVLNLHVQPSTIKIEDTFAINATIVNNYNNTISIHNGCGGPFSIVFDNHVTVGVKKVCNFMAVQIILQPHTNITLTSLASNLDYVAKSAGIANANVTISYILANQTGSNMTFNGKINNISKLLSFTISPPNPIVSLPLEQFRSGIVSKDIICHNGFQLILKAENNHPACVTHNTAVRLMNLGWATSS